MFTSLTLVRPLVLSFFHRLRPGSLRQSWRPGLSMLAAVAGYALIFSLLSKVLFGGLKLIAGLSSLRGFSSATQSGLEVRVASLGLSLALGLLFVVSVAGSAARSLDLRREGGDLWLLLSQPVDLGRVLVARSVATALLDPLGLLLIAPLLIALIALETGASLAAASLLAVPIYLALRTALQAAAFLLILMNRAWLPQSIRAEPAALSEAGVVGALLLWWTGVDPAAAFNSFRASPTLVEPLSELTTQAGFLVPKPLALLLDGTVSGRPLALVFGWASLLGILAFCQLLASRFPMHLLAAQARQSTSARALGRVWDQLWPLCAKPTALVLLKDLVTAWRANLMMAPALGIGLPAAVYVLHRFRDVLAVVPLGAVMSPVLLMAATASAATLCDLAEGPEPPPLPISRGRLAALKAISSAGFTTAISVLVLVASFPLDRSLPALPWVAASAALLAVALAELLAFAPGAAAEVFTPAGMRTAALWAICAIGLAGLAGDSELATKLPVFVIGTGTVCALWGREQLLAYDRSIRDMVVMVGFFLFASQAMGLLVGFAAALGAGVWAGLGGTAALQLGLGWMTLDYLRQSASESGELLGDRLGLPAAKPIRRAAVAAVCGSAVALGFGLLGGLRTDARGAPGVGLAGLTQMLLASALGPLVEECFFRATLQRSLSAVLGRMPGLLVSSLVFASAHPGPPSVTLFVLGCVLGLLYERKKSVFEPAVAHMAFNHLQVVLTALGAEMTRVIAP